MRKLFVKVCGMLYRENIEAISALDVDYLGLIFAEGSPRKISGRLTPAEAIAASGSKKRVGVFSNSTLAAVSSAIRDFDLSAAQLHGAESPQFCQALKKLHPEILVVKALQITGDARFEELNGYGGEADLFLFDAAGPKPGGNGVRFDWNSLKRYSGATPFMLAGGVSPEDAGELRALGEMHPLLHGVDLNSRFETEPGMKDSARVRDFVEAFRG